MIEFATLFLGLVLGVREVEVVVGDPVAAVEVFLGERRMGTVSGPPWKFQCDFGDELKPQKLVAVGLDASGKVVGQAHQWINLPQPPAQVTVVIEEGVARLSWESRAGARPLSFKVIFDGQPLEVERPEHIVLPPHDLRQLHFLRAELEFSENVVSVAEVSFGGTFADQVSSELTAYPVFGKSGRVRRPGALDGLLLKKGGAVQVVAVEQGPAEVVVVVDDEVLSALGRLPPVRPSLRNWARFRKEQNLRVLWPTARPRAGSRQNYALFPTSHSYGPEFGGFYFLVGEALRKEYLGEQHLADAVAVAGLHASGQRQRRAVVLLLGNGKTSPDRGQLTPKQARDYLRSLRVPFEVWSMARKPDAKAWGEVVDASTVGRLERAVEGLAKALDRQYIAWVEGIHLPQEITIAPDAKGLELVH